MLPTPHDIVFNGWVALADERKAEVVERHWSVYKDVMDGITGSTAGV
jgi:hypothetical protein